MSVNQLVVVIGGTRGTGLLIAQRLQRQGVPVRILARNPERARARLGPTFPIIAGDITQPDTIPRAAGVCPLRMTSMRLSREPSYDTE